MALTPLSPEEQVVLEEMLAADASTDALWCRGATAWQRALRAPGLALTLARGGITFPSEATRPTSALPMARTWLQHAAREPAAPEFFQAWVSALPDTPEGAQLRIDAAWCALERGSPRDLGFALDQGAATHLPASFRWHDPAQPLPPDQNQLLKHLVSSAFYLAVETRLDLMRCLVDRGASLNAAVRGLLPTQTLGWCTYRDLTAYAELWLTLDDEVVAHRCVATHMGKQVMHGAHAPELEPASLKWLFDHGASPNARDASGTPLLHGVLNPPSYPIVDGLTQTRQCKAALSWMESSSEPVDWRQRDAQQATPLHALLRRKLYRLMPLAVLETAITANGDALDVPDPGSPTLSASTPRQVLQAWDRCPAHLHALMEQASLAHTLAVQAAERGEATMAPNRARPRL